MASVRTETRPCRWCGRSCPFQVQLTIVGVAELVTEQKCIAADRVLRGQPCEPSRIDIAAGSPSVKRSRPWRGRR